MKSICDKNFLEFFIYCLIIFAASMLFWLMIGDISRVKNEIKTDFYKVNNDGRFIKK